MFFFSFHDYKIKQKFSQKIWLKKLYIFIYSFHYWVAGYGAIWEPPPATGGDFIELGGPHSGWQGSLVGWIDLTSQCITLHYTALLLATTKRALLGQARVLSVTLSSWTHSAHFLLDTKVNPMMPMIPKRKT